MFENKSKHQFDFNAKSNDGRTGFILACEYKKEKAVDLILANYKDLKIDLKIKDNAGRSGMELWTSKFKGLNIEDV